MEFPFLKVKRQILVQIDASNYLVKYKPHFTKKRKMLLDAETEFIFNTRKKLVIDANTEVTFDNDYFFWRMRDCTYHPEIIAPIKNQKKVMTT